MLYHSARATRSARDETCALPRGAANSARHGPTVSHHARPRADRRARAPGDSGGEPAHDRPVARVGRGACGGDPRCRRDHPADRIGTFDHRMEAGIGDASPARFGAVGRCLRRVSADAAIYPGQRSRRDDDRPVQDDFLLGMGPPPARPGDRPGDGAAAGMVLGAQADPRGLPAAAVRAAGVDRAAGDVRLADGAIGIVGADERGAAVACGPSADCLVHAWRTGVDRARSFRAGGSPGRGADDRAWRRRARRARRTTAVRGADGGAARGPCRKRLAGDAGQLDPGGDRLVAGRGVRHRP